MEKMEKSIGEVLEDWKRLKEMEGKLEKAEKEYWGRRCGGR